MLASVFSLLFVGFIESGAWIETACQIIHEEARYFVTQENSKIELPTKAAFPELRSCRLSEDKQFLIVEILQGLQGTQSLRATIDLVVYKSEKGRWTENKQVSIGRAEKTKSGIEIKMDDFKINQQNGEVTIVVD